jgi:multidrug efflux pump
MFVILEPFEKRQTFETMGMVIMFKLRMQYYKEVPEAVVSVFGAPPVQGLGTAGGFKVMVEDPMDQGPYFLQRETEKLLEKGREIPGIAGLFTLYSSNSPQLFADIDRTKVRSLGVSIKDINETLTAYVGSKYVNNFNAFGRFWQVNVMAEPSFRSQLDGIEQIKMRNQNGEMVPLGSVVDMKETYGPGMVMRYNLFRAAPVNGIVLPPIAAGNAPTLSSGQAIQAIDRVAEEVLPRTMRTEWTELAYLQLLEARDWRNHLVFPLAVVFVFLVLAALYESWSLPLAVILVVPMCLLCAVVGVLATHTDVNIFTQIGLVVLVGLASKNAILIVEFAKQLRDEGKPLREATCEACRLRLRPILMTSLAFILGVVPLVIATGAGWEMRRTLGLAVFSGMLGVTLFGILLTPVFFYVIQRFSERPELDTPVARRVSAVLHVILAIATLGMFHLLAKGMGQLRKSG